MKRILFGSCFLLTGFLATSQAKEGKITFERTVQFQLTLSGNDSRLQNIMPRERKDKFELLFSGNKILWKPAEKDNTDDEMSFGDEGGPRIVLQTAGMDDISFFDLTQSKKIDQRELGGKNFIISDSISKMNWKITGETKTILGYKCMKATSQRMQESTRMTMENGQPSRKTFTDTLNISAWFTNEIPGSYGPENYQGQLPGTILELDINNGRTLFKAINIERKVDVASIKEPTKGKKLTQEEFVKEREKLFDEMQQNGGGGMRRIRVN